MSGTRRRRIGIAGAVAALLALATLSGTAAAAPTSWRLTHTPTDHHGNVVMSEVSCPAARACISLTQGSQETLVWNGRAWQRSSATPRFAADIDCPATTMCVAVGGYGNRASVDIWDGAQWTPSAVPGPGGYSELDGVSCVSTTWCMAAGRGARDAFFEQFDGAKWTLVDAPTSLHGNAMYDVSCTSETHCLSVGVTFSCRTCHTSTARAEIWDGEQWTETRRPLNPGPKYNDLLHVSCGAPDRCVAVGQQSDANSDSPLIEQWKGRRWTLVPAPVPPGATGSEVDEVSCARGLDCIAVGRFYSTSTSGAFGQLIASWNGTAWSYPEVEVHPRGELHGVDCFDGRRCVAVGRDFAKSFYRPLAFAGTSPKS